MSRTNTVQFRLSLLDFFPFMLTFYLLLYSSHYSNNFAGIIDWCHLLHVVHATSCSFVCFPTIRHNELRDFTVNLLSQVFTNIQVEPQLQPLSGESLSHRTSNSDDHARLDILARGFWNTSHEQDFVDVRVFNPLAKSHLNQTLPSSYCKNSIWWTCPNVEHGTFTFQLLVAWDQLLQLSINV